MRRSAYSKAPVRRHVGSVSGRNHTLMLGTSAGDDFDIDLRLGPWQSASRIRDASATLDNSHRTGSLAHPVANAGLITEAECVNVVRTGAPECVPPAATGDSQPNCGCTNPNWCDTNTCELTCEDETDTCGCPTVGGGATCDAPGCGEITIDTCGVDCEDQTGGDDTCDGCESPSDAGATCVDCDMTSDTCAAC